MDDAADRLRRDVHVLAGEIGPRGTGTRGEAAAADHVSGRLAGMGLEVERYSFSTVASQNAFPLAIDLLTLLGVAIYPVGGGIGRWIGAGLCLSAAPLLWQTIRNAGNPLGRLLPKVESQNVQARVSPGAEPVARSSDRMRSQSPTQSHSRLSALPLREALGGAGDRDRSPAATSAERTALRRAVVLAHLDTNRCRYAWQSASVRHLEPLTWLTLGVLASLGVLYLAGALHGGWAWWWVSLLPTAYVLGTVVTLIQDDRTPFSPGAHDNAASVAVALEVASRLRSRPLLATEVWFVFDGAEETDHAGVRALLRRHGQALSEAAFLGLEGLGSGEIVYLTRQGLCSRYRPSGDLHVLAERVASGHPDLGLRPGIMLMEDDVRTLRQRGLRAICIAGRDPETGTLPHWHRPDDTEDTVCVETMDRAVEIVVAMLREIDRAPAPE